MPDLIAKPALAQAPLTLAGVTLSVIDLGEIHAVAPFPGQEKAVAALFADYPQTGRFTQEQGGILAWSGRDAVFLIGAALPVAAFDQIAAVTPQGDAWAGFSLSGGAARDVLARLVPLDLRAVQGGEVMRSALNHVPLMMIVHGPEVFHLLVYRSMARTAWHELHEAMQKYAARQALVIS